MAEEFEMEEDLSGSEDEYEQDNDVDEQEDQEDHEDGDEQEEEQKPSSTSDAVLRQDISSMPLSKVRALKAELGVKLFNKTYFNKNEVNAPKSVAIEDSDEEKKPAEYKREKKHRPREMSTKMPLAHNSLIITKKKQRYDPRFECGDFDAVRFSRDYAFINDMKKKEVNTLKRSMKKAGEEDRDRIRETIKVMENQVRASEDQRAEIETRAEIRAENIKRLRAGQKPLLLNRKQMRVRVMEKKFDKIKEGGSAKQYVKKRRVKAIKKGLDVD